MTNTKYKSYAKVNLFLKIVGIHGNYHKLFSRFLKVYSLFDVLSFEKNINQQFFINSNFSFPQEQNIIFQTYLSLLNFLDNSRKAKVEKFFKSYSVQVVKNIPMMAGLGGGSSNSATFLIMVDEVLNLNLSIQEKSEIVKNLGSDILFFLYEIDSANVFGTGNIIEKFDEDIPKIDVFTPDIKCHTGKIYQEYRKNFFKISNLENLEYLKNMKSTEIFQKIDINFANDLFAPAKSICPKLESSFENGYLFSGSGSSFFKLGI
jgi:4-diphosphocytidyl-2-C-methyl-D-erythritol kinase